MTAPTFALDVDDAGVPQLVVRTSVSSGMAVHRFTLNADTCDQLVASLVALRARLETAR